MTFRDSFYIRYSASYNTLSRVVGVKRKNEMPFITIVSLTDMKRIGTKILLKLSKLLEQLHLKPKYN